MALQDPSLRAVYDLKVRWLPVCILPSGLTIRRFLFNATPISCWRVASGETLRNVGGRSMVFSTS